MRVRILFKGVVQGVGFRPHLYRSAKKYNLPGFVKNTPEGVILEVEGEDIDGFKTYLLEHIPPLARIDHLETCELPPQFPDKFEILASDEHGDSDLPVSPDIAVCGQCIEEFFAPDNRRYKYPFINCTDCGPRFTIIRELPYDRPRTTMKPFPMCEHCGREYVNPEDRRFHAQPVACFLCGPSLSFHNRRGKNPPPHINPVDVACDLLREGKVTAIKGLGGYHLACKATSDAAVLRLRQLKRREQKPFALMGTLDMILEHCRISPEEEKLLLSPSAPIVLLRQKSESSLSRYVAPEQNHIGFMVPYTPLHLLLMEKVKEPLVMTSANISDQPIIYRDKLQPLKKLADGVLRHNRKIHIFADDSVSRIFEGKPYPIRRSRGYVPLPLRLPLETPRTILALGPMLKTTFTFLQQNKALISQYIGTTDSPSALEAERAAIKHYMKLFALSPEVVVTDMHPEYPNRLLADDFPGAETLEIQHHRAHVGSLLAEKEEMGPVIGIAMDGTGYGDDGCIWGGEFFAGDYHHMRRAGHLKYLFLPSGDQSIHEPWRFALSVLNALYNSSESTQQYAAQFHEDGEILLQAIRRNIGGVQTSSCGRLFDAAACLLEMGHSSPYDGYLPSILQAFAENCSQTDFFYNFSIEKQKGLHVLDLLPTFHDMLTDPRDNTKKAYGFHNTLARGFATMARKIAGAEGITKAALTGGVFQNTLLLRMTKKYLEAEGFEVLIHSEVPPNDGGVSLGQAFLAAAQLLEGAKKINK